MRLNLPRTLKPVVDLSVHLIVGTIPFVILLVLTSALESGIHWLEAERWLTTTAAAPLVTFKTVLLYGDFFLYGLFWVAEMIRFAKSLKGQISHETRD